MSNMLYHDFHYLKIKIRSQLYINNKKRLHKLIKIIIEEIVGTFKEKYPLNIHHKSIQKAEHLIFFL